MKNITKNDKKETERQKKREKKTHVRQNQYSSLMESLCYPFKLVRVPLTLSVTSTVAASTLGMESIKQGKESPRMCLAVSSSRKGKCRTGMLMCMRECACS